MSTSTMDFSVGEDPPSEFTNYPSFPPSPFFVMSRSITKTRRSPTTHTINHNTSSSGGGSSTRNLSRDGADPMFSTSPSALRYQRSHPNNHTRSRRSRCTQRWCSIGCGWGECGFVRRGILPVVVPVWV